MLRWDVDIFYQKDYSQIKQYKQTHKNSKSKTSYDWKIKLHGILCIITHHNSVVQTNGHNHPFQLVQALPSSMCSFLD